MFAFDLACYFVGLGLDTVGLDCILVCLWQRLVLMVDVLHSLVELLGGIAFDGYLLFGLIAGDFVLGLDVRLV